jgi:hypothetical protein
LFQVFFNNLLEEAISMLKPKGAVLGLDGLLDSDDESEDCK